MTATAELIIRNARIYTVDPAVPWASALAASAGRLLAVGNDDVAGFRGPAMVERDAGGSLTPGKSADFVILDSDPFARDENTLARTRVLETWFAGSRVFLRDA
ncbi:amidohydrolase family protein [Specibacter cremeus]|uniref:amidohydrolase family protein n=1 Tax=Specibacter cremeus TaxID=1629051 RepID=UPI000F775498|nr:amidohydrolase family protein [Specibacter cremeus]